MYLKRICVVTGTRAEYHLLYPLMKVLDEDEELELYVVVTGSHLCAEYGNTFKDIEKDGFTIAAKIPILRQKDDINEINLAMSRAIAGFSACYGESHPDMVVLLGDRYELLSAAIAAMNYRIPIAHIHGGETTEGAIDECIRHAITKMSYLHFTSCEAYRKRVIQLGEDPKRVFNVGAIGLENIRNHVPISKLELEKSLNFALGEKFAVVTFHPVTLEENTAEREFEHLLKAFDRFPELRVIFTKANADSGGLSINQRIDEYVAEHSEQAVAVYSLGRVRYLTALQYAAVVIGNSSSGIIETPSFCVPTINIGDRQRGRIQAKNVINCVPDCKEITEAMKKALSSEFADYVKDTINPYGDGVVVTKILSQIKSFVQSEKIDLKKKFYNIEFDYEGGCS